MFSKPRIGTCAELFREYSRLNFVVTQPTQYVKLYWRILGTMQPQFGVVCQEVRSRYDLKVVVRPEQECTDHKMSPSATPTRQHHSIAFLVFEAFARGQSMVVVDILPSKNRTKCPRYYTQESFVDRQHDLSGRVLCRLESRYLLSSRLLSATVPEAR